MQTSTSQQQHQQHQQPPYTTPLTSASTLATNGRGSARSSVARGSAGTPSAIPHHPSHSAAYPHHPRLQQQHQQHPPMPPRTAGDSWSLKREGDRTVIVIEDTPPPASSSSSAYNNPAAPAPAPSASSRSNANANAYPPTATANSSNGAAAKRTRYNNGSAATQQTQMLQQRQQPYVQPAPAPLRGYPPPTLPSPAAYQVNHNALAGPSSYPSSNLSFPASNNPAGPSSSTTTTTTRKVSNQKRKYNEVIDPATAVSLSRGRGGGERGERTGVAAICCGTGRGPVQDLELPSGFPVLKPGGRRPLCSSTDAPSTMDPLHSTHDIVRPHT